MGASSKEYRIGIAGWNYPAWRKSFYPEGLVQKRELEYASTHLRTIEINGTFYSLQKPESFERWYAETPDDFVFSVKGPKFITHMKKLHEVEGPLANFFGSGILALKEKLGPILWQLPPNLTYDRDRLEDFFKLLPRSTTAGAARAKKSDAHLKHTPYTKAGPKRKLRYALEVRHESFKENEKEFVALLIKHDIALVCADAATRWPYFEIRTADFAYARLHGASKLYTSKYSAQALAKWEKIARAWHGRNPGHEVFMYFDNDAKVHAPFDAMNLQKKLDRLPT